MPLSKLLLLLIATGSAAQTTAQFSASYGDPDSEQFVVSPGIVLMAGYDHEHRDVCAFLIKPKHSMQESGDKEQSMARGTVTRIIDELIPQSERGVLLNHLIEDLGASELQTFEYENVVINRYFIRYLRANHDERSATVVRKDLTCNRITPQIYMPVLELTALDLHARYGDPDVERFLVRPGINLIVTYSPQRRVCEMIVEPEASLIPHDEPEKDMPPELAREILDELLPEQTLGGVITGYTLFTGGHAARRTEYESVVITHVLVNVGSKKPEMETRLTIESKKSSCQAVNK